MAIAHHSLYSAGSQEPVSVVRTRKQLFPFLAGVLVLICSVNVATATLSEYQQRVRQTVTALESLSQIDEDDTEATLALRTAETLSAIRSTMPSTEVVEWRGEEVSVDNRWLHQALESFEQATGEERSDLLVQASERLKAIEERLDDAQSEGEVALLTKEEANARLAEILKRPHYARKEATNTALNRLLDRFLEWLRALLPRPQPLPTGQTGIFSTLVQVFVVVLALAAIGYSLKLLISYTLRKRRFFKKKSKRQPRIVLGEKLTPDQRSNDLLAEAEALARNGDLRAAIRKAYIALLVELGDRKLLSLESHKTNRDYLQALESHEAFYEGVKRLTHSFEVHWYGFSIATEDDWQAFLSGYRRVLPG